MYVTIGAAFTIFRENVGILDQKQKAVILKINQWDV